MTKRLLQPGEPVPAESPRRYLLNGYVALQWRDVWCYEHRLVMGLPEGMEVHHLNGDKTDNRPENLEVLRPTPHRVQHGGWNRGQYKRHGSLSAYGHGCRCDECRTAARDSQRERRRRKRDG